MNTRLALLLLSLILAAPAWAKDDRRECAAELAKLKEAFANDYITQNHRGYRQAKASRNDGDYKKCVDIAKKARERAERERNL